MKTNNIAQNSYVMQMQQGYKHTRMLNELKSKFTQKTEDNSVSKQPIQSYKRDIEILYTENNEKTVVQNDNDKKVLNPLLSKEEPVTIIVNNKTEESENESDNGGCCFCCCSVEVDNSGKENQVRESEEQNNDNLNGVDVTALDGVIDGVTGAVTDGVECNVM